MKYKFNKHLYSQEPRTQTIIHHVYRYTEALKHFDFNDTVLDIGCGNGYGTSILNLKTDNVTGIDPDGEGIHYAKEDYPTIDFFQKGFELEQKSFDFFVAFEVIEHLDDIVGKEFINFFKLRCKKGFILSTPTNAMLDKNPCHKRQITEDYLMKEFGDTFDIELKYQNFDTGHIDNSKKSMIICTGIRKKGTGEQWW